MTTKEWLLLAKEDVATASQEIKGLYDYLNKILPESEIKNSNVSINDIFNEMYKIAKENKVNNYYCMCEKEVKEIAFKVLGIEENKSINDISFEDLL